MEGRGKGDKKKRLTYFSAYPGTGPWISDNDLFSLLRVLKPDGKQFMKAPRLYIKDEVDGEDVGSRIRNSSSMFEPRRARACSAPCTSLGNCRGRTAPVVWFCKCVSVRV
jgi:hypothetical protein